MGSYGDWTKENHPVGNFVQKFNERHNIACERRARDAPLRMKFLALLGLRRPFDRWCADTPLHLYLDKLPKFWEEDRERDTKTDDELEVTPEMVKAGIEALMSWDDRLVGEEEVVIRIYTVMVKASTLGKTV